LLRFCLDARMENFLRGHHAAFEAWQGVPRESHQVRAGRVPVSTINAQAAAWCNGLAADRRCPEDLQRSAGEVFAEEAPRLLPLPDNPAPLLEQVAVSVDKTPYVRFDLNDYSVPHTHVRRVLTVLADPHEVRTLDGATVLASHPRSHHRDAQIELPGHVEALVDQKAAARQHRATDRLVQAAPPLAFHLLRRRNLGQLRPTARPC
jgi:hypothetical protein